MWHAGEPASSWPDPPSEMDLYCINIFCDDRDFELKPWQQNGGIVYEEDKAILREMWRMHNDVEEKRNPDNTKRIKKGKKKVVQMDEGTIREALINKGYGLRKGRREKKN
jgi:hypothetical protein